MKKPKTGLIRQDDYEVGYRKPPKQTQFKPGHSGNKRGRPKGTRNFQTDLKKVLNSPTVITQDGKPKKITTQMAALERLRQKALQGDARALDKIIELAQQSSENEQVKERSKSISKDDDAILERYLSSKDQSS